MELVLFFPTLWVSQWFLSDWIKMNFWASSKTCCFVFLWFIIWLEILLFSNKSHVGINNDITEGLGMQTAWHWPNMWGARNYSAILIHDKLGPSSPTFSMVSLDHLDLRGIAGQLAPEWDDTTGPPHWWSYQRKLQIHHPWSRFPEQLPPRLLLCHFQPSINFGVPPKLKHCGKCLAPKQMNHLV